MSNCENCGARKELGYAMCLYCGTPYGKESKMEFSKLRLDMDGETVAKAIAKQLSEMDGIINVRVNGDTITATKVYNREYASRTVSGILTRCHNKGEIECIVSN